MKKISKTKTMFALIMGALLSITQPVRASEDAECGLVFIPGIIGFALGFGSSFYLSEACGKCIYSRYKPCQEDLPGIEAQKTTHTTEKAQWQSQEDALKAAITLKKQEIAQIKQTHNITQPESQPTQSWNLKSLFSCPC